MDSLRNKVVAVTGAGSGIGRALAKCLAREGSHLALGDISQDALMETASQLSSFNIRATTHIVDVSEREQVHAFADEVVQLHGYVDAAINNAGVTLTQTIEEASYEDIEWVMRINIWGVIYGTKAFLPYLKKRPQAHIVNVSSTLGLIGSPVQPAYCLSKFAVRGFTESLRLELAGTSVRVSCVYPGGVRTNLINNSRFYKDPVDPTLERPDKSEGAQRFNSKFGLSSSEDAANAIVKGIRRNKQRIFVGRDARMVDYMSRLWPLRYASLFPLLYYHFEKRPRRLQQQNLIAGK